MNCTQWNNQLDDYMDNTLSSEARSAFEAHMASCSACKETFELFMTLTSALDATEEVDLPDGFHEGLMDQIKSLDKTTAKEKQSDKVVPFRKRMPKSFINIAAGLILVTVLALFGMDQFNMKLSEEMTSSESSQEMADSALYESPPEMVAEEKASEPEDTKEATSIDMASGESTERVMDEPQIMMVFEDEQTNTEPSDALASQERLAAPNDAGASEITTAAVDTTSFGIAKEKLESERAVSGDGHTLTLKSPSDHTRTYGTYEKDRGEDGMLTWLIFGSFLIFMVISAGLILKKAK